MEHAEREGAGHRTFEHTADVGLEVWAPGLPELFEEAGQGFVELMLDTGSVAPAQRRAVRAEGQEPEELLVAWLEEILFAFDAEGFAPAGVSVLSMGAQSVEGELKGEPFDRRRHRVLCNVKAVTYHDLAIKRTDDRCEVRIVFDV